MAIPCISKQFQTLGKGGNARGRTEKMIGYMCGVTRVCFKVEGHFKRLQPKHALNTLHPQFHPYRVSLDWGTLGQTLCQLHKVVEE